MDWLFWVQIGAAFLVGWIIGNAMGVLQGAWHVLRNPPAKPLEVDPLLVIYMRRTWPRLVIRGGSYHPDYSPDEIVWQWPSKLEPRVVANMKRRGRPRGSLSAQGLPPGTTLEDIRPFLVKAKRAQDAGDGSFQRLCEEAGYPESTVRTWLGRYSEWISTRE